MMIRVLLVIEDYNELIYLQSFLKKMGFDMEGIQNQKKFSNTSLAFNPKVIIVSNRAANISQVTLTSEIKKHDGFPKVLFLTKLGTKYTEDELKNYNMDRALERPVNLRQLILDLADLGGIEKESIIKKFDNIKKELTVHDPDKEVSGEVEVEPTLAPEAALNPVKEIKVKPPSLSDEDRKKRYASVLAEKSNISNETSYSKEHVQEIKKQISATETTYEVKEIYKNKKKFVKALFKK